MDSLAGKIFMSLIVLTACYPCNFLQSFADEANDSPTKNLFDILCNSTVVVGDNIEIQLTDLNYTFSSDSTRFCVVSNKNITLLGNQTGSKIICSEIGDLPTQGIAFINSTVTIRNFTFVKCGVPLKTLPSHIIHSMNNSLLYYSSDHAAALIFVSCKVVMNYVNMNSSYGFSLIGIDLLTSVFDHIQIMSDIVKSNDTKEIGYGLLLHFANSLTSVEVKLSNCKFDYTFLRYKPLCLSDIYGEKEILSTNKLERKPIVSTTIFTVLYTEKIHPVLVTIERCQFVRKFGWYGSCLLITHYGTHCSHSTVFTDTTFTKDFNQYASQCHNTAQFSFIFISDLKTVVNTTTINPLKFQNTKFLGARFNDAVLTTYDQKTMYIGIFGKVSEGMNITMKDVEFRNNIANGSGTCMQIESKFKSKVSIFMESVIVELNRVASLSPFESMSGIFTMQGITCYINGSASKPSLFKDNYGIVIDGIESTNVYISGHVQFISNKAINGPAINLNGDSRLYFINYVNATFEKNRAASLGGAIFIVSTMLPRNGKLPCGFHFDYETLHPNSSIKFSNNNAADGGKSIYAFPIVDCYINNYTYVNVQPALQVYNTYFSFHDADFGQPGLLLSISTLPASIERIIDERNNSTTSSGTHLYPGQPTSVCLCATDQMNRRVYSSIELLVPPGINNFTSNTWLLQKNKEQIIREGDNCTEISFSLNVDFIDKEYPLTKSVFFYTSTISRKIYYTLNPVLVLSCPLGFSFSPSGSCTCSKALKYFSQYESVEIHCDIETQIFTRSPGSWVGLVSFDQKKHFAVATSCPIGHCTRRRNLLYFHTTGNDIHLKSTMRSNILISLCHGHRIGPLCGKCKDGLSIVFGTNSCYKCSSNIRYWLFIVTIALLGPLLVLALFILKITLTTGTLNGIVFYANILDIDLAKNFFLIAEKSKYVSLNQQIVEGFLSLINFRFGFPVCFLKEMSELQKAEFGLVFPFYLLLIVLSIIIVSRYSLKLAKTIRISSVQVLITVVHFSISKILLATALAFSATKLYTDIKPPFLVWYYDGTVRFLKHPQHLTLVAFTLVAFVIFVIPYFMFLIFTKKLSKHYPRFNLLFRPIYEAVHAPYKPGREYWFTIRMITLVFICILDAYRIDYYSQKTNRITATALICLLLIGQSLFHPFKHKLLSLLDNWVLLNLLVVYGAALILPYGDGVVTVLVISGYLIIATSVVVLLYHIMWVTGILIRIKTAIAIFKSCRSLGQSILRYPSMSSSALFGDNQLTLPNSLSNSSDDDNADTDGFREPLLAAGYFN